MTLKEYLDKNKLKPTHFANLADIAPSVVSKHLRHGHRFSVSSARKVEQATGGAVSAPSLVFVEQVNTCCCVPPQAAGELGRVEAGRQHATSTTADVQSLTDGQ